MTVCFDDVLAAADRIAGHVHETPLVTSELLNDLAGCDVFLKAENLQKTGAFKARGAANAVLGLADDKLVHGVATHSSGNHGAALARAAAIRQVPAYVVVPRDANVAKQDAIAGYGAQIVHCEPTLMAREQALSEVVARTGAQIVHPYDQAEVIAGQGTAMLELIRQAPALDAVIVPVGGGGLLAGSLLVAANSNLAVYGAEPQGAADTYRSLRTGIRETDQVPETICDGLRTTVGVSNFKIIQEHTAGIFLASDERVVEAMQLLWSRTKLLVEPSGAIALACLLENQALFAGRRIGLMITGGNVDLTNLPFTRARDAV